MNKFLKKMEKGINDAAKNLDAELKKSSGSGRSSNGDASSTTAPVAATQLYVDLETIEPSEPLFQAIRENNKAIIEKNYRPYYETLRDAVRGGEKGEISILPPLDGKLTANEYITADQAQHANAFYSELRNKQREHEGRLGQLLQAHLDQIMNLEVGNSIKAVNDALTDMTDRHSREMVELQESLRADLDRFFTTQQTHLQQAYLLDVTSFEGLKGYLLSTFVQHHSASMKLHDDNYVELFGHIYALLPELRRWVLANKEGKLTAPYQWEYVAPGKKVQRLPDLYMTGGMKMREGWPLQSTISPAQISTVIIHDSMFTSFYYKFLIEHYQRMLAITPNWSVYTGNKKFVYRIPHKSSAEAMVVVFTGYFRAMVEEFAKAGLVKNIAEVYNCVTFDGVGLPANELSSVDKTITQIRSTYAVFGPFSTNAKVRLFRQAAPAPALTVPVTAPYFVVSSSPKPAPASSPTPGYAPTPMPAPQYTASATVNGSAPTYAPPAPAPQYAQAPVPGYAQTPASAPSQPVLARQSSELAPTFGSSAVLFAPPQNGTPAAASTPLSPPPASAATTTVFVQPPPLPDRALKNLPPDASGQKVDQKADQKVASGSQKIFKPLPPPPGKASPKVPATGTPAAASSSPVATNTPPK